VDRCANKSPAAQSNHFLLFMFVPAFGEFACSIFFLRQINSCAHPNASRLNKFTERENKAKSIFPLPKFLWAFLNYTEQKDTLMNAFCINTHAQVCGQLILPALSFVISVASNQYVHVKCNILRSCARTLSEIKAALIGKSELTSMCYAALFTNNSPLMLQI
jgi:hypothetical protein